MVSLRVIVLHILIDDVPEMHDRIIAATALAQGAAIITKDESLRRSKAVEVVW